MHYQKSFRVTSRIVITMLVVTVLVTLASCSDDKPVYNLDQLRVGENISLRYWMPRPEGDGPYLDMAESRVYKELERVTGVRIEFEHPVYSQANRQLELLRQNDDLADIIEFNWLQNFPDGPDAAIDEGVILPLRDLIIQNAPNLFKRITENDEALRAVTSETGRFYAFPHLQLDAETRVQGGLMIRRKWLDQINASIPETINDWRNLLITMREADFDTIGDESEYPFFFPVFRFSPSADAPTYYFLEETNAFAGSWGTSHDMYRDASGRVSYGPIQDSYRDMLTELNRWYEEDLIHPNIAEPGSGRSFFRTVSKCGASIGAYSFMDFLGPFDYQPAPPPILDEGIQPIGSQLMPIYTGNRAAAISASSTNSVDAIRFLDVAYGEWGDLLFNFGIVDESFAFDRGEPVFTDEIVSQYDDSLGRGSELSSDLMKFTRLLIGGPFLLSASALKQIRDPDAYTTGDDSSWLVGARPTVERILEYDRGRRGEFEKIMAPITAHARANFAAFLTGQRPLSDFEVFVREIESLNVGDAISILYNAEAEFYTKVIF